MRLKKSKVHQRQVFLNIFISALDKETKGNLIKFLQNTKLESVANMLNGRTSAQRDPESDEDLAKKKLCEVQQRKVQSSSLAVEWIHVIVQTMIC